MISGRPIGCRPGRFAALAPVVLVASVLAGCSLNPPLDLDSLVAGPSAAQLLWVPFYPQQEYQCGPAALAGVLGAAGVTIAPAVLTRQVFLPGRQGSLQPELLAATRRAGLIPYLIPAEPSALLMQLRAGKPVLVLQNLQTRSVPVWHYAVVVGFDTARNQVYLNSGGERGLAMSAPAFLRTWDWAGRWAMVALRPGELPAQPEVQNYIEALATFESVAGSAPAAPAWRAALRQWPQDSRPYLALGNNAYSSGNLPVAIDYYRRGLQRSPGDPALANNLASVLGELGCPEVATSLLLPVSAAAGEDSRWQPLLADTLAELAVLERNDSSFCAALYRG